MSDFGATVFTPGVIDNNSGLISLVADLYVGFLPNPSGSGVLATIEFQALAPGLSALTFSNVFLNFSNQGFNLGHGQVAVPEPTTLALLTSGLALFAGRRRATRGR